MDSPFFLLGLCAFFIPTALGVGAALLLEQWLGRWAYLLGWLLSVILLAAFYGAFEIWIRVTPCEPANSLACGESITSAFILFVGILCVVILANGLAQVGLYLYLETRVQPSSVE